jgi:hypothetical protein
VTLSEKVNKQNVPHQDFVLMFRSQSLNKPVGLVAQGPEND